MEIVVRMFSLFERRYDFLSHGGGTASVTATESPVESGRLNVTVLERLSDAMIVRL